MSEPNQTLIEFTECLRELEAAFKKEEVDRVNALLPERERLEQAISQQTFDATDRTLLEEAVQLTEKLSHYSEQAKTQTHKTLMQLRKMKKSSYQS